MVTRSASRVQAEIASDLGYGSAEPPRVGAKRAASQAILVAQPPGSFGMMPWPWFNSAGVLDPGQEEVGQATVTDL